MGRMGQAYGAAKVLVMWLQQLMHEATILRLLTAMQRASNFSEAGSEAQQKWQEAKNVGAEIMVGAINAAGKTPHEATSALLLAWGDVRIFLVALRMGKNNFDSLLTGIHILPIFQISYEP